MLKRNADRPALVLLLAIAAFTAMACAGVAKPDGWASPVESGDVLVAANHDTVVAFTGDALDELWLFPPPDAEIRSPAALYGTPAIADGAAFVPSYDREELGSLHKLDIENGDLLWTFEGDNPFLGSVTVSGGVVYFGDNDGNVYALDAGTGEEVWDSPFQTDEQVWAAPVIAAGVLYVTSLDGHLYALDPASGEQQWSFSTEAGIAASPVVDTAATLVYIAGFDSHVRAIDIDSGEQRWSFTGGNAFWATPLLLGGTLYAADADGNVYAIDSIAGTERWDDPFQANEPIRAGIVEIDGSIYIVDRGGNVYALNPNDGVVRGDPLVLQNDVFADPLPRGNELIIVTANGDVVQIDPQNLSIIGLTPI